MTDKILMTDKVLITSNFELYFDYDKAFHSASRVFSCLSEIIETLNYYDNLCLKAINIPSETIILIEQVKPGSIRTFLKNTLMNIDDDSLKSGEIKKIIGSLLVNGKKYYLDNYSQQKEINSVEQLDSFNENIYKAAKESSLLDTRGFTPVPKEKLITVIEKTQKSLNLLTPKDKLFYKTSNENHLQINNNIILDKETLEKNLVEKTVKNNIEIILQVKKPDYLGNSIWDFKWSGKPFSAKVSDYEWLNDFQQERKFELKPRDSIEVLMKTTYFYNKNNELINQSNEITKVKKIIPFENYTQQQF